MGSPALSALAVAALLLFCRNAQTAELKLIVAVPMMGVIKDLAPEFERNTGHKISAKYVSGPIVKQEINSSASYDVAISITPVIDALIKEGKLIEATRADVAFATVGVGVRAGAPKPDIRTVESFKQALLSAKSVAHSATGASGDHFKSILQRLGIAEQMQPKLRPMPADTIAQAVPSGQAEMIVVTASVILVPGAELVGPVPPELQFYNRFAAAVGNASSHPEDGRDLIKLLTSPAAVPILRSRGMEPGVPK